MPSVRLGFGLALVAASFSFVVATIAPHHLNMFWQIPDGEEILRGHIPTTIPYAISAGPLVSQEWLYEAAMAWFALHHAYGAFALICALAAGATPLLTYAVVRAFGVEDVTAGIAAFLTLGSRFAGSATRPETFAVDAFALMLYLLARGRGTIWLVPTVVSWANLHASVVLAPFIALTFALCQIFAHRAVDTTVRRSLWATVAITLSTLVTPLGFGLWSYAFALAVAPNPTREHLDAWRALAFDVPGVVTGVLPGLLVLICCGAIVRRRFVPELAIASIWFVVTLAHERYAMFLSVAWATVIARSLDVRTPISRFSTMRPQASIVALFPIALYVIFVGVRVLGTSLEPAGVWQNAARLARDNRLSGNTYAPYIWAAYLHWQKLPLRLLIDSHGDPYRRDVWNDHLALENVRPNWREVLTRRSIRVVIVPDDTPLAAALSLDRSWSIVEKRSGIDAFALKTL